MRRSSVHPHHFSQSHGSWNQKSPIWTPDQRTHLLVSFSSCFLQQFDHEGLIHAVSSEQLMLRCFCYLNSLKHLFGLQFLKLATQMNFSSAAESKRVFLSCVGPHEIQFHHSTRWFLRLDLKKLSMFLKCSALTDLHVLK